MKFFYKIWNKDLRWNFKASSITVYNQKSRTNRIVVVNYCFLIVEIHSWLANNL